MSTTNSWIEPCGSCMRGKTEHVICKIAIRSRQLNMGPPSACTSCRRGHTKHSACVAVLHLMRESFTQSQTAGEASIMRNSTRAVPQPMNGADMTVTTNLPETQFGLDTAEANNGTSPLPPQSTGKKRAAELTEESASRSKKKQKVDEGVNVGDDDVPMYDGPPLPPRSPVTQMYYDHHMRKLSQNPFALPPDAQKRIYELEEQAREKGKAEAEAARVRAEKEEAEQRWQDGTATWAEIIEKSKGYGKYAQQLAQNNSAKKAPRKTTTGIQELARMNDGAKKLSGKIVPTRVEYTPPYVPPSAPPTLKMLPHNLELMKEGRGDQIFTEVLGRTVSVAQAMNTEMPGKALDLPVSEDRDKGTESEPQAPTQPENPRENTVAAQPPDEPRVLQEPDRTNTNEDGEIKEVREVGIRKTSSGEMEASELRARQAVIDSTTEKTDTTSAPDGRSEELSSLPFNESEWAEFLPQDNENADAHVLGTHRPEEERQQETTSSGQWHSTLRDENRTRTGAMEYGNPSGAPEVGVAPQTRHAKARAPRQLSVESTTIDERRVVAGAAGLRKTAVPGQTGEEGAKEMGRTSNPNGEQGPRKNRLLRDLTLAQRTPENDATWRCIEFAKSREQIHNDWEYTHQHMRRILELLAPLHNVIPPPLSNQSYEANMIGKAIAYAKARAQYGDTSIKRGHMQMVNAMMAQQDAIQKRNQELLREQQNAQR